jgi:hypothetical protein
VIHGPDLEPAEVDSPDTAPDKAGLYYSKSAGGGLEASTLVPEGRRFIDKGPKSNPGIAKPARQQVRFSLRP